MSTLSEIEKNNYINQLFEFLSLPSISADSRYNEIMQKTGQCLLELHFHPQLMM